MLWWTEQNGHLKWSAFCFLWFPGHQYSLKKKFKKWWDGKFVNGAVGACLCIQGFLTTDYTTHTPLQRAQTLPVFTGTTGGPPPQTHTLPLPLALLSLAKEMQWIFLSLTVTFLLNYIHDHDHLLVKLTSFLLVSSGIRISGRLRVRLSHSHPTGRTCTQTPQLQEAIGWSSRSLFSSSNSPTTPLTNMDM